jgi:hypothetical protein
MSDEHDQGGELPSDPFKPYDSERIAKETGGQILGTIPRSGAARLDIGFYEHPHNMPSLNSVTIRLYGHDGELTGMINLGGQECLQVIRWLQAGAAMAAARYTEGEDG